MYDDVWRFLFKILLHDQERIKNIMLILAKGRINQAQLTRNFNSDEQHWNNFINNFFKWIFKYLLTDIFIGFDVCWSVIVVLNEDDHRLLAARTICWMSSNDFVSLFNDMSGSLLSNFWQFQMKSTRKLWVQCDLAKSESELYFDYYKIITRIPWTMCRIG
jgi:hypothetical protein